MGNIKSTDSNETDFDFIANIQSQLPLILPK